MFRAFLKRWILAESLVYKWHPSVPFAQRFDHVDRHRLQLPLRLRHHMVHVLNMFYLCLMSNHAKAPKVGAFADLGRVTTYRTNYCVTVGVAAKIRFEVAQGAISPLASPARGESALARRSRPRTT